MIPKLENKKIKDICQQWQLKINYSKNKKEIIIQSFSFLSAKTTGDILYVLNRELNYLGKYCNFVFLSEKKPLLQQSIIEEYLSLIINSPFLWKKNNHLFFFLKKPRFLDNVYYQTKTNTIDICCLNKEDFASWKTPAIKIKKIFQSLGVFLSGVILHICDKENSNCQKKKKEENFFLYHDFPSLALDEKKKILQQLFSQKKIYELSLHSRFSTLDGISSPKEYFWEAKKKNYQAIGFTEHYNVQSFPEIFSSSEKEKDLKIVYGCELEMFEEKENIFFLNLLREKAIIEELTYCVFDLETTGLFSEYKEIIEIGYIKIKNEKIIAEEEFLIRPEKEFSLEELKNWYHQTLSPEELKKQPSLEEILKKLKKDWKDCILVAHNALNFDYGFLNKAWQKIFQEELPFPIIDTLPLSWLFFPEKKSYSLEKLSNLTKKKIVQTHRALDDSKLLGKLFLNIIQLLKKEKIKNWLEIKELKRNITSAQKKQRKKIKILVKNQQGLLNLYHLLTVAHTENFSKAPCLKKTYLKQYREGLLIGSSGGKEGETFSLFSEFNYTNEKKSHFLFYDFIEINSPYSLSFLTENGMLKKEEIEDMNEKIINLAEELNIPYIASHNVHYHQKREKLIKDIIIANEGNNGNHHYLYWVVTNEEKEDCFANIPFQHLLSKDEMISQWTFCKEIKTIENILFNNPKKIIQKIEKIEIKPKIILNYSDNILQQEKEIKEVFYQKANSLFGNSWPWFVKERIEIEWNIIQKHYVFIFWIAWKITTKAYQDGFLVGSRGSVGSSFIAFLCGITELNPLPHYKYCSRCFFTQLVTINKTIYSCYDYTEKEKCPICHHFLEMKGLNMPMETFFGISGEKTPDIDLNFSGEYQKTVHNFVRELLGKENVHRIGTINTLKKSMADIFWHNFFLLKKKINSKENKLKVFNNLPEWQKKYKQNLLTEEEFTERKIFQEWIKNEEREEKKNNFFEIKEEILHKLEGIKRTTGQHPGGLLIIPPGTNIELFTPLNYPADKKTDFTTTHLEYKFLSQFMLKIDILGHDEPTVLQKLFFLTKRNPLDISFSDEKIMNLFKSADTLGVTEFGTDLVRKILSSLQPEKFSHLVQICGFAHGTNVWGNNQQIVFKEKKLPLDQLISSRDDIWNLLQIKGIDKQKSYLITEYIRKGEREKIDQNTYQELEKALNDQEGKIQLEILNKIKYILPKPHAVAYTMTAWRNAFYKVYFPREFYSVFLTYHIVVYDVWLMTLNEEAINFRLTTLISNLKIFKNSEKELISIVKVLQKIKKKSVINIEKVIANLYQQLENEKALTNKIKKESKYIFLTSKEKNLLLSLKIFIEMDEKQLNFRRGIDLNNSEESLFNIKENTFFFPLIAINGFGQSVIKKIILFREQEKIKQNNWKKQLESLLNINHLQQLSDLEKNNMLIWTQ